MPTRITIPEPCHADWNQMMPAEKGRHCTLCAKTVVDFTSWPLEDIASYLRKHSSGSVCGRFRGSQLNVEIPYSREEWVAQVAGSGYSLLQKMALIFLLAFGFLTSGCTEEKLNGAAVIKNRQITRTGGGTDTAGLLFSADSSAHCGQQNGAANPVMLGEPAAIQDSPVYLKGRTSLRPVQKPVQANEVFLQGAVAADPEPPVTAGAPMMVEGPTPPVRDTIRLQPPTKRR